MPVLAPSLIEAPGEKPTARAPAATRFEVPRRATGSPCAVRRWSRGALRAAASAATLLAAALAVPTLAHAEPINQIMIRVVSGDDDLKGGSVVSVQLSDRHGNTVIPWSDFNRPAIWASPQGIPAHHVHSRTYSITPIDHRDVGVLWIYFWPTVEYWRVPEFPQMSKDDWDLRELKVFGVTSDGRRLLLASRRADVGSFHRFETLGFTNATFGPKTRDRIRLDLSPPQQVACPTLSGHVTLQSDKGYLVTGWPVRGSTVRQVYQADELPMPRDQWARGGWDSWSKHLRGQVDAERSADGFVIGQAPPYGAGRAYFSLTNHYSRGSFGAGGYEAGGPVHLTCFTSGEPGTVRIGIRRDAADPAGWLAAIGGGGAGFYSEKRADHPNRLFTLARWQPKGVRIVASHSDLGIERKGARSTAPDTGVWSSVPIPATLAQAPDLGARFDLIPAPFATPPTGTFLANRDYVIQLREWVGGDVQTRLVTLRSTAFGAPLTLEPSSGPNQAWNLDIYALDLPTLERWRNPRVLFRFWNTATQRVMDVSWGSTAPGATVAQYGWVNGSNQKFSIKP